jgi:hypothetical protein
MRVSAVTLVLLTGCDPRAAALPDGGAAAVDARPDDRPPGLGGLLIDANQQPLARVDVLACMASTCLFGESDADGHFEFLIEPPAAVALKTHPELARTPRWAAALEPVHIADSFVDTGVLCVPELPAGTVLGPDSSDPQTLDAGDGLELTVRRADLTPPLGEILHDVAARRIAPALVPLYAELAGEEVLAVYALHPFAAKSSSPVGVRAPVDAAEGAVVGFRTISEIDGTLSTAAPGRVVGGVAATDAGAGIGRLTYLVISR